MLRTRSAWFRPELFLRKKWTMRALASVFILPFLGFAEWLLILRLPVVAVFTGVVLLALYFYIMTRIQ
ncbi:hypothetical protein LLE49_02085 [Alicyclobacillus tolerans]|uniref:hypothetical protein n=1 Tax=Alicyclobacillus tolerans TaxID=90970 RepID=UPI001F365FF8|nr:hypothetical protein [Alicyclobacillus tolerans]MCF8563525.1 hypothetical protein [Alicyclobacillus tolerans]